MNKQHGFSLIELFISLAIGLALFAGVLSVFVGMRTTSSETSSFGNMQETGRFAISVLTDDLMRQGFWGDMYGSLERSALSGVPATPGSECVGGGFNNGTFPANNTPLHFRALWGATATVTNPISCINNAKLQSDVIQIKRTISSPVLAAAMNADRYYLVTNSTTGQIIDGADPVPASINNATIWEYQHHVYYVSDDSAGGQNYPVLNRIMLVNGMDDEPLIDGVEMVKFMYGVDVDNDSIVDTYVAANNMTQAFWDNEFDSRIRSVKMFVLVRDIEPDSNYTNRTVYQLGDTTLNAFNDNYRRMLFSSTVTLFNGDIEVWN